MSSRRCRRAAHNLLLTTATDHYHLPHYSLLTTHHSPLTTHHSPLTTHHSALSTQHSALPTHHSPLTTHHSLQASRIYLVGFGLLLPVVLSFGYALFLRFFAAVAVYLMLTVRLLSMEP